MTQDGGYSDEESQHKIMDCSSCEKISIRESARSLKKYGSTSSKNMTRNENYIKHYVAESDTLQGIALKYDVTIEKIRRANKMWPSDSLFLKEFLLIPVSDNSVTPSDSSATTPIVSPMSNQTSLPSMNSFDEDNISEFLGKIDASIASTKEEVEKTQNNSEFISNMEESIEGTSDRRKQIVTRINNNGSTDYYSAPQAMVVHQGSKKVKSSIKRHEKQQDEIFEL